MLKFVHREVSSTEDLSTSKAVCLGCQATPKSQQTNKSLNVAITGLDNWRLLFTSKVELSTSAFKLQSYQVFLTVGVVLGQLGRDSGGLFSDELVRRIQALSQDLEAPELVKVVGLQANNLLTNGS